MKTILNDKQGSTLEGWVITIVFCIAIVICFGVIIVGEMNSIHGTNYSVVGLPTSSLQSDFQAYQSQIENATTGGEKSFTTLGFLMLGTAWDTVVATFKILKGFFSINGWIANSLGYLHIPTQISLLFIGLLLVSMVFLILKSVFRMKV